MCFVGLFGNFLVAFIHFEKLSDQEWSLFENRKLMTWWSSYIISMFFIFFMFNTLSNSEIHHNQVKVQNSAV